MGRASRAKQERREASAVVNMPAAVQLTEAEYRITKTAFLASKQAAEAAYQANIVSRALWHELTIKYQFDGDVSWTFDDATCQLLPPRAGAQRLE